MAEDHLSMQGFMANSMTPPLSQRINSVNSFDSSGQHTPHPSPGCGQSPGDMNGHHDAFSDFSRAVRFALDPGIINNNPMGVQSALLMRQQAEAYLTGLKSNPRIWDFCTSIFQKPREHFEATEVFWGCSVLIELVTQRGDYFALPESGKAMFEATLLTWAKVNCSHLDLTKFQFVQNKFAQLLVIVFQHSGYPTRWTTFFEEIFALLPQGMQLIDLWLRILKAIDTHIVEHLQESTDPNVRARDTLIKDSMRATCMQQVTNTWYHILSQYHQTCPDISRQCMQVMAPYFAWIDIQMVTSEQWINMLYHFVSQPDLRDDAVVCLAELCGKKIADTRSKLQLLKSLRVADAMPELVASILNRHRNELTIGDESFDDGTGFLSNVTDLCLAVGVELMDLISSMLNRESAACKDEVDDAIKMLHTCLPMLFELLACGHSGISLKVCEHGVRRYVELLKKHPVTRAHLPSLLTIVAGRMAYFPDFFDFEETGDYEMTVNSLRKQLLIVFRNIATLEKDLALNFVVERVRAAVAACANTTVHWPQVEATLRILHCFGEELGATRATVFKQQDSVLSKVISEVFHCNISSAGTHQALSLAFLDVVERFYQYFSQYPDSIPLLLQFTLGNTGAYHPHPRVRAKACAIFSSLARVLKPQLLGSVQLITASVEGLLESSLEMNDKCALYETLGILIAPQGSDFPQAAQYLKLLSQPLLNGLNASLQQQGSGLLVANNTLFLAYLSKGFSGLSAPTMGKISGDVTAIWKEIAEAVVHCCRVYATVPQVREKVLLFMHRIIDLLGRGVSAYIPPLMECLISNCDLADMSKLVRVPTQLLQRIKREIVPGLEPSFAPLITRVFQVTDLSWLDKGPTTSEQAREHLDLLRAYYGLLAQATQPECIDVFVSDNSRKIFNQILDSIVRGCVSNPELDIAKTSYQIMTKMATCWYSSLPGFSDFLAQQAIPMTVATVKQAHYNPNDAKCHSVAGEIAALYLVLNKAAGEDAFINALKSAWSLPDDHAAMMKQVLSTNDQKAVRNLTKTWAAAVRGQG